MAASELIGAGLGLGQLAAPKRAGAALIDMDFVHRRFAGGGKLFGTEAAFLAEVGGVRAGNVVTIGPSVVGPELVANGDFASSDLTGWAPGSTHESNVTLSVASNGLRAAVTTAGIRFGRQLSLTMGKAYRTGARAIEAWAGSGAVITFNKGLMFSEVSQSLSPFTAGQQYLCFGAAEAATMYLGIHSNTSAPRTENWDDFTVKEAVPVVGHNHLALSGVVEGTTPAAASGNKVVFQADDAGTTAGTPTERNRLRLVWDSGAHLRLVITVGNVEQANIDLGEVAVSTPFRVAFSAAQHDFKANLDGGFINRDTNGLLPAMAAYRIGRSNSGEAWDGAVERVQLFAATLSDVAMADPAQSFAVWGDSTARGDGTGVSDAQRWHAVLGNGYARRRTVHVAGVGGETTAQMLARLVADPDHRRWTTLIMDRPNSSAEDWLANVKAAAALLLTDRWLVMPPVLNAPSGQPDSVATKIAEVQAALLTDPFFAGHTLAAAEQAAYVAAMNSDSTRVGSGDFTHFSAAGQAIQASTIRSFLDAMGW